MLVGYMRVSSDSDRQTTALQRDALLAAGMDERQLFEDKASGARDDRPGLAKALEFVRAGDLFGGLETRSPGPLVIAPADYCHALKGKGRRVPLADRTNGHHHTAW